MVQIIPANEKRKRTFGEQVLGVLDTAMPEVDNALERRKQERLLGEENEALGIDKRIKNPKLRESVLEGRNKENLEHIKADEKRQTKMQEMAETEQQSETIGEVFGPTAQKLWSTLPTGARTEATKVMLDAKFRGESAEDIDNLLKGIAKVSGAPGTQPHVDEEGFQFPPKGVPQDLKPSERPAWQENRRKENFPILKEAQEKLRAYEKEGRSLGILEKLAPQIPDEFSSRIQINPTTEQPYGVVKVLGKVPVAVQRWIKTINDFTTQAKDSYGSRVTNFDLQQFMARLPGLMNTPEGRQQIIQQMQSVNKLNALHDGAIKKVFQHYGAGNITLEDAEAIVEENIRDQRDQLTAQLNSIGDQLDERDLSSNENLAGEAKLPPGTVIMVDPQGNELHVPESDIQKYQSLGAKLR